jgi:hypothetical protein
MAVPPELETRGLKAPAKRLLLFGLAGFFQMAPAQHHGLPQVIFDGARGEVQAFADFPVGKSVQAVQQEDLPRPFGQAVDGAFQAFLQALAFHHVLYRWSRVRQFVVQRFGLHRPAVACGPQVIPRQIGGNGEQKRVEIRNRLLVAVAQEANISFLGEFRRRLPAFHLPQQEFLQLLVSTLEKIDQFLIGEACAAIAGHGRLNL